MFNSMDVTKRPLYTGMSGESIRLSKSVLCACVQHCYIHRNWLYGLGSLMFKISPIMSLFSVCHFFQCSFLCPYSLLSSVPSHFNMRACLAPIWQLGWGAGKEEDLCRACDWMDYILEGITFTGCYWYLPTPHNGKPQYFLGHLASEMGWNF